MSHGTHEEHGATIAAIRRVSQKIEKEVAILADLQGPKIRVDKLEKPLKLQKGQRWFIGSPKHSHLYKENFIPTIYENLVDDCHDGAKILFDDGLIQTKAIKKREHAYEIEIITGGTLKSKKGINLPDCDVSAPSFTKKDRADLFFGLENEVDYIALSFLRRKSDLLQVKSLLHELKKNLPIIVKIEKAQAIENLDEILELADAVMVARGDMGVEIGNHLVPSIQKVIINKCNSFHIPVITATQMLESMTEGPTPTRAEASDVANAVWDGTDAVMLSGETAAGKYPVESVEMMDKIIKEAEKTPKERPASGMWTSPTSMLPSWPRQASSQKNRSRICLVYNGERKFLPQYIRI